MRAVALLALVLAFPATASATGATEVDLGGTAVERLQAQGVKLVAKRPARLSRGVLRLPVRQGLVGSVAHLNHSGALHLRKGRRVVRFTRLQTRLGAASYVNATARGRRIKLFTLAAEPSLNSTAGTASVRDARLTLTRAGARAIRRALKLRRLPAGRFGRATVDALVQGTTPSPGGPGGGPPQSGPITDEPPVLTRPASATDIASATVTWHVRDSFVRYVSSGEGVQAIEGAAAGPAVPQEQHPCPDSQSSAAPPPLAYSYTLPFAHGWRDGSRAAIYTTGGARFLYSDHGIDLTVHELEIELTGAEARVIARFSGAGDTNPGNRRAVLVNLVPLAGDTYKGTIPAGGSQSVFGGFYGPGDGFGCVTVSFSP
jgi:Htaa protein